MGPSTKEQDQTQAMTAAFRFLEIDSFVNSAFVGLVGSLQMFDARSSQVRCNGICKSQGNYGARCSKQIAKEELAKALLYLQMLARDRQMSRDELWDDVLSLSTEFLCKQFHRSQDQEIKLADKIYTAIQQFRKNHDCDHPEQKVSGDVQIKALKVQVVLLKSGKSSSPNAKVEAPEGRPSGSSAAKHQHKPSIPQSFAFVPRASISQEASTPKPKAKPVPTETKPSATATAVQFTANKTQSTPPTAPKPMNATDSYGKGHVINTVLAKSHHQLSPPTKSASKPKPPFGFTVHVREWRNALNMYAGEGLDNIEIKSEDDVTGYEDEESNSEQDDRDGLDPGSNTLE